MGSSTIIDIQNSDIVPKEEKKSKFSISSIVNIISLTQVRNNKNDMKKLIHSIKVGVALVLVSLLYIIDPLYLKVGENAMWAIMTVVVVFEFYAGATLSKGLNRGIGTILGGGLGCLAAVFAQQIDGIGNAIVVGSSVFIFVMIYHEHFVKSKKINFIQQSWRYIIGAVATFTRMIPTIKKRYDYGAMIFILTFNLVVVSGLRAEKVMEIARQRLSTIGMGFAICICTSLLVFPMWASDELHISLASNFENLACSIEGTLEDYFQVCSEKKNHPFNRCKSIIYSKAKDETLANFAKWEPWHGKFGLSYPWERYLQMGEVLRELAVIIVLLEGCLQSPPKQASTALKGTIKEACERVGFALAWTLRELGESIMKMRRCRPKLESLRVELGQAMPSLSAILMECGDRDGLAISSFIFLLMEMVDKVEELSKQVEHLGEININ